MSLLTSFTEVIDHLQNRGELMKAYVVARNAPSLIEDKIVDRVAELKSRLQEISDLQNHGTVNGRFNPSFLDPEDKELVIKYRLLKKFVLDHKLENLVDVGCYTGWIGRGLSTYGIAVRGIDIQPVTIQIAAFAAAGSLATFEYLPVQKLGFTHPKEYDGVILFDVLEHCFDSEEVIKSCEMSLKDGGYVMIILPSVEGEQMADLHHLGLHEHLYSYSKDKVYKMFDHKKKASIDSVINEGGAPNWWITYAV